METTQLYTMEKIRFTEGTLFSAGVDTQKCGKKLMKLGDHNGTVRTMNVWRRVFVKTCRHSHTHDRG